MQNKEILDKLINEAKAVLNPSGVVFGICPDLIATAIPNLVLSEHFSISF